MIMIRNSKIDNGKAFDFGRTSYDYAKYRDIYPQIFYDKILEKGLCVKGQTVLDLGTGTGVLPRNLCRYGAKFIGIDISENQIKQAVELTQKSNLSIEYLCSSAERASFESQSFDVVTACQCFSYFDHDKLAPKLRDWLKPDGKFVALYMAWLPYEDVIAGKSEELILKYNPLWTGCGEKRRLIDIPDVYLKYFDIRSQEVFDASVVFTKDGWRGRIKTCRGIEASLSKSQIASFDREHKVLLDDIASENFEILHYCAICVMSKN